MTAAEAAVLRYVRAPLTWALLLAAVLAPLAGYDLRAAGQPLVPTERAVLVTGRAGAADGAGPDELPVVYVHPATEQQVELDVVVHDSSLRSRGPGPVQLVVDRDDPDSAWLAGDRFPAEENLYAYGWWPLLPLLLSGLRWWRQRSVRRLQAADVASYALLGAVSAPRLSAGRCLLHLYELDARPGSPPVCTVPLVTTAGAPLAGPAVPVEVKGVPRPHGLVVARSGDRVLPPSGRALSRRGLPRPDTVEPVDAPAHVLSRPAPPGPPPPGRAWYVRAGWRLPAAGAALLVLVVVAALTVQGHREAVALERDGARVLARVTAADPALFEVEVEYADRDGRVRAATAPADFPEEFAVGRIYPAVAVRGDPDRVRLLAEPYDPVEPIVWAALPLLAVTVLAGRWGWHQHRIAATARRGPWAPVEAWRVSADAVALLRPGTAQVACAVPVEPLQLSGLAAIGEVVVLDSAGVAAPGEPVALRQRGADLVVLGLARAAP